MVSFLSVYKYYSGGCSSELVELADLVPYLILVGELVAILIGCVSVDVVRMFMPTVSLLVEQTELFHYKIFP